MEAAQKIKCVNNGWFVCCFQLIGGGDFCVNGDLPMQKSEIFDLTELNFQEGAEVYLCITAVMGKRMVATEKLLFTGNDKTATFEVQGTSLDFGVQLTQVK